MKKKVFIYFLVFALFSIPLMQVANAAEVTATASAGPITSLGYQSREETKVTLRWPEAKGAVLLTLEQRQVGSLFWTKSTTQDWLWPNATSATLTGLTTDTLYEFRLVVVGGENAGISNTITVKTDINLLLKIAFAGNLFDWNPGDGTIYKDLTYGSKAINKYDLYIPTNASKTEDIGVVLHIHGGSWTGGDKSDDAFDPKRYAQNGYIAASMNYSLAGGAESATIETMLDEIEACIAALKQELTTRGYHVNRMALAGSSAGAHLASLFAYSRTESSALPIKLVINKVGPADFHPETWEPIFDEAFVAGFLSMLVGQSISVEEIRSGAAEQVINSVSPLHYISSSSPATVMAYGGYDQMVPHGHNEKLLGALQQAGVDYQYTFFSYSDHVLGNDPDKTTESFNKTLSYLKKYLSPLPLVQ